MKTSVLFLGGGVVSPPQREEWGASCAFGRLNGINFVVDAGIKPKLSRKPEFSTPNFKLIQNERVDIIFITHAHADHVGALAVLAKQHPNAQIWMTWHTADLAETLLSSSLSYLKHKRPEELLESPPLFSAEDLTALKKRIQIAKPEEWEVFESAAGRIEFCFWPRGHLPGNSAVLLKAEGAALIFGSDTYSVELPTVEAAKPLPQDFLQLRPVLFTEGTNGATFHLDRKIEEARVTSFVREVNRRGGNVLLPAFSIGSAQNLVITLAQAGIPTLLGGKIAWTAMRSDAYLPFAERLKDHIHHLEGWDLQRFGKEERGRTVVASHGMLEHGSISHSLLRDWMADQNNAIVLTGYQAEGSLGRYLQTRARPDQRIYFPMNDDRITLKAEVQTIRLSSHDDLRHLVEGAISCRPREVVIGHADEINYRSLSRRLENCGLKVQRGENNREFEFNF